MAFDFSALAFVPGGYGFAMPPPSLSVLPRSRSWRLGQFAVLKWEKVIKFETSTGSFSTIRQYTHIDQGAEKHPLCIIGSHDNGKYAACVLGTSFGNTPIQEKYPKLFAKRQQYLAIQQGNTTPHDDLPVLDLANDRAMLKQTYLDMDRYFLIEADCLDLWSDEQLQLDDNSLATLQRRFVDFVSGTVKRARGQFAPRTPMDLYGVVPQMLGVNDYRVAQRAAEAPKFKLALRQNCAITIRSPEILDCNLVSPMVAAV